MANIEANGDARTLLPCTQPMVEIESNYYPALRTVGGNRYMLNYSNVELAAHPPSQNNASGIFLTSLIVVDLYHDIKM